MTQKESNKLSHDIATNVRRTIGKTVQKLGERVVANGVKMVVLAGNGKRVIVTKTKVMVDGKACWTRNIGFAVVA